MSNLRLIVSRDSLVKAVEAVRKVIPASSTLPVLTCVHLAAAENGKVTVVGNGLDMALKVPVNGANSVLVPGETLIPAAVLSDTLAVFKDSTVDMALSDDGQTLTLTGTGMEFQIKTLDPAEFPALWTPNKPEIFSLPAKVWRKLVYGGAMSAATDNSRPILTGAYFTAAANRAGMVSADGFRLVTMGLNLPEPLRDFAANISAPNLYKLAQLLPDDDKVQVETLMYWTQRADLFTQGQEPVEELDRLIFRWSECEFITTVIGGQFPDYQQIVPKQYELRFLANKAQLRDCARKALTYSPAKVYLVIVEVGQGPAGKPFLVCYSKNAEYGYGEGEMAVGPVEPEPRPFRLGLNAKYLIAALDAIPAEEVEIRFQDKGPVRIDPVDAPEGFEMTHVIMPMNTENLEWSRQKTEQPA